MASIMLLGDGISDWAMNVPLTFPLSSERQGAVDYDVDLARPVGHGQAHFLQASLQVRLTGGESRGH